MNLLMRSSFSDHGGNWLPLSQRQPQLGDLNSVKTKAWTWAKRPGMYSCESLLIFSWSMKNFHHEKQININPHVVFGAGFGSLRVRVR